MGEKRPIVMGRVCRTYRFVCGLCPNFYIGGGWYHDTTKKRAEKHARAAGWKKTKAHGWICPRDHRERLPY